MFQDDDTRAWLHDCEFHLNRALFGGGGVVSQDDDSEVHFYNCNFTENRGTQGGVFYLDNDAKLHVADSTITNNECEFTGAVVRATGDGHMFFQHTWSMWNYSPRPDSSSFGFFDGHISLTVRQSILGSSDRGCPYNYTINDVIDIDETSRNFICQGEC